MKRYIELFRIPNVWVLLLACFPARVAYGMVGLGIFFKVKQATGSISFAALAVIIFFIADFDEKKALKVNIGPCLPELITGISSLWCAPLYRQSLKGGYSKAWLLRGRYCRWGKPKNHRSNNCGYPYFPARHLTIFALDTWLYKARLAGRVCSAFKCLRT